MKQVVLFFLIVFFPISVFSQCNFTLNEVDDFTSERNIVLEKTKLVNKRSYKSKIHLSKKGESLYLTINANDKKVDCYTLETTMLFKFMNGDVITLQNLEASKAKTLKTYESENGELVTIQNESELNCDPKKKFKALIDENILQIFKNQELEKIRITDGEMNFDYDVKVGSRFKISKQAACLDLALK